MPSQLKEGGLRDTSVLRREGSIKLRVNPSVSAMPCHLPLAGEAIPYLI